LKPPKRIKVGPVSYELSSSRAEINEASVSEKVSLIGYADHSLLKIILHPDMAAGRKREVLLHETLHCLTTLAGINAELDEDDEEKFVNRLAPVLLDLLRRNPRLVGYLTDQSD
jgi:hypothetical protein